MREAGEWSGRHETLGAVLLERGPSDEALNWPLKILPDSPNSPHSTVNMCLIINTMISVGGS